MMIKEENRCIVRIMVVIMVVWKGFLVLIINLFKIFIYFFWVMIWNMDFIDCIKVLNFLGFKVRKNCMFIIDDIIIKNNVNIMVLFSFLLVLKIFL